MKTASFDGLALEVPKGVFEPVPQFEAVAVVAQDLAPPGGRVLDLGCGAGSVALALARRRPDLHVVGLDHSERAVAAARRNALRLGLRADFVVGDAWRPPVRAGSIDIVTSTLPYDPYAAIEPHMEEPDWAWAPIECYAGGEVGYELVAGAFMAARGLLRRGGTLVHYADVETVENHDRLLRFLGYQVREPIMTEPEWGSVVMVATWPN